MSYLTMVRKKVKDAKVDSELAYAFAAQGDLAALEDFIGGSNQANLQAVGDRLFEVRRGRHCATRVGRCEDWYLSV